MKQHKWHKEIKAWADGAEIEIKAPLNEKWITTSTPVWFEDNEYRIKPQSKENIEYCKYCSTGYGHSNDCLKYQHKESQYLYVYQDLEWSDRTYKICRRKASGYGQYVGKIKLEVDE